MDKGRLEWTRLPYFMIDSVRNYPTPAVVILIAKADPGRKLASIYFFLHKILPKYVCVQFINFIVLFRRQFRR